MENRNGKADKIMPTLIKKTKAVAIIVAHPDDETIWAGGTVLENPSWNWYIFTLCRAGDNDRAPKFYKTLKILKAKGFMADLDDGPEQKPLPNNIIEETISKLLPRKHFDILITHNPLGEYTRHIRHEETSKAVTKLWQKGIIRSPELWTFAYEDGNGKYFPRAIETANLFHVLPEKIWKMKYKIITETYGFKQDSWEAKTTPATEAFWITKNNKQFK
jgi:LmbE family N-acetylglucosaminyl deacetylase